MRETERVFAVGCLLGSLVFTVPLTAFLTTTGFFYMILPDTNVAFYTFPIWVDVVCYATMLAVVAITIWAICKVMSDIPEKAGEK